MAFLERALHSYLCLVYFAMAETMDKTEMLILEVSKNPVLFDKAEKDYKDATKKKDIWKGIGEKIALTGKEVETRWKNVCDGFSKYQRKQKCQSGDAAKSVKEYKYAKALSPYLGDRPTSSNLAQESDEDSLQPNNVIDEEDESQISDFQPRQDRPVTPMNTSVASSSQSKSNQKPKCTQEDLDVTLCRYLKKKSCTLETIEREKLDDVDLFLQSKAYTIRKLPAGKRSEVKIQIHAFVHKAEMQCCFHQMTTPFDTSERPNLTSTGLMTSVPDRQPMDTQHTVSNDLGSTFLHGFQAYNQFGDS